jgi:hypothetical protein
MSWMMSSMEERMRTMRKVVAAAALIAALAIPAGLSAQVPPHYPGSVCLTPTFWCFLQPPLPPGSRCFCATPSGAFPGVAG